MDAIRELLAIRRTVTLWEARADAELGACHGLSLSEFAALHHLLEAPAARLRRVDVAQKMALTPSGVTRLFAPLEKRGLVARESDGHDARATYAVLTRSGKTLVADAARSLNELAESILASLGARDRAAFTKLATP